MSITSITIENFKGIRDRVKIDLKPITLLFGPNSGGKSTIIQALHYAWEVIGRHNLDPNFTEFGGREIDLGGFENLVYRHDLSRSISIRLDIDLKGKKFPEYGEKYKYAWDVAHPDTESFYDGQLNMLRWNIDERKVLNGWVEIKVSWNDKVKKALVSAYDIGLNNEYIAKVRLSKDTNKVNITYINFFHPLLVSINDDLGEMLKESCNQSDKKYAKPKILECVEALISKIAQDPDRWITKNVFKPDKYNIFVSLGKFFKENNAIIEKLFRYNKLFKILKNKETASQIQSEYETFRNEYHISSDYDRYSPFLPYEFLFFCIEAFGIESINKELNIECLGLNDALPSWDVPFSLGFKSSTEDDLIERDYYTEAIDSAIMQFVVGPGQILKDELKKMHYLGPIRNRIHRNYVPNRYIENRNWPNGLAAWDVLHKEDEKIVNQVDSWMADRLKSGYHITRKSYKEIDVSKITAENNNIAQQCNLAPTKTRLYLIDDKNNIEVQPPDVGVGISQVIPVIVSALYFKDGIVAIEQPELHIHPALQVTLGDLFISQIQEKGLCFLLETHSEHMLLRMLRRIRETHENKLQEGIQGLTPDQIKIYYIENDKVGVKISALEIDETGEFKEQWPHGFFEEREEELLY
jgi:AAA15 family ATPase/GTPase